MIKLYTLLLTGSLCPTVLHERNLDTAIERLGNRSFQQPFGDTWMPWIDYYWLVTRLEHIYIYIYNIYIYVLYLAVMPSLSTPYNNNFCVTFLVLKLQYSVINRSLLWLLLSGLYALVLNTGLFPKVISARLGLVFRYYRNSRNVLIADMPSQWIA